MSVTNQRPEPLLPISSLSLVHLRCLITLICSNIITIFVFTVSRFHAAGVSCVHYSFIFNMGLLRWWPQTFPAASPECKDVLLYCMDLAKDPLMDRGGALC